MATQVTQRNVLQQFVERAGSLYSLPAVAMEVLELTGRPGVDTVALRQCVERDPALTAKLLRVVNSSVFGLSREVSDLTQALALLGVKPLKLLVLGFSLPKELHSGVEARTLQQFWKFTLVKAVAAREMSKSFWSRAGDEAFIAGLLQEIGVLALVKELGDSYVNFLSGVHERGENLAALETVTLGFDHAIFSARLLDHWKLPSQIVQAVAVPHEVEYIKSLDDKDAALPQTLHLATLIALIIVHDRKDLMAELLDAASQYRGIAVDEIEHLLDKLQEQVLLMADLFSVQVSQQDSFRDIMARAHQQMSDAAIEALPQIIGCDEDPSWCVEQEELHKALDQYAQSFLDVTASVHPGTSIGTNPPTDAGHDAPSVPTQPAIAVRNGSCDPGLQGQIVEAIATCRVRQRELSLILLEIDNYENLLVMYGPERTTRVVGAVQRAVQTLSDIPVKSTVVSDVRLAVVLPNCERRQAINLARSLKEVVPVWLVEQGEADALLSFSTGIASLANPTHSSHPEDLIAAADRCLFAAKRTGGSVIKSIDVL